MSLDLTLLPYNSEHVNYSHIVLSLQTNSRDLFEEIERLSKEETLNSIEFISEKQVNGEVEKNFASYLGKDEEGETAYGDTIEDEYGLPIRWVRASVLQGLTNHDSVKRHLLNKQAWGYINSCPPDMRIALYWH